MFALEFITTTTGAKLGTVNLKGSGIKNTKTVGGSVKISSPNAPAKVGFGRK